MRTVRLRAAALPALLALLQQDVHTNLFLLDLLERRGLNGWTGEEWYGVWDERGEVLRAAALIIGRPRAGQPARLGVAYGEPAACTEIGARARWSGAVDMIIGPRAPSDGLWAGLRETRSPRVFYDQRLYLCTTPTDGPGLPLRQARVEEASLIEMLSGQMMLDDLGVDPRATEPARHRLAVRRRLEEGRTLVSEEDGEVVFMLDIRDPPAGGRAGRGDVCPGGCARARPGDPGDARGGALSARRGRRGVSACQRGEHPRCPVL